MSRKGNAREGSGSAGVRIPRRSFLCRVAAGSAASAFPAILPRTVWGGGEAVAPSNRVAVGLIGCGGRMAGVQQAFSRVKGVEFVAVCDVVRGHRERVAGRLKLGADRCFGDFRELLARADVDAVAIATPDHWHVPVAIAAIKAGKDVYCEKPLSNTIFEGRALVETARRHGAVFQHGTQLHSMGGVRRACELVRNGRIGSLKEIVIGSPPGRATGNHPVMPVPEDLDYDRWLGPAPEAPYTRARVFHEGGVPGWYFIADYSKAGWIAGYGVHDLDIAQWGMGAERGGPVAVEGQGVYPADGLFDTVMTYRIEFTYADGVKIVMTDTGQNRHGVKFVGEDGWIFTRGGLEASSAALLKEVIRPSEVNLYRSPGHVENFVECIRSRGETITPPEIAHRATSTALLGGIACNLKRPLRWNPERERFVDDPVADRLLHGPMRAPWGV